MHIFTLHSIWLYVANATMMTMFFSFPVGSTWMSVCLLERQQPSFLQWLMGRDSGETFQHYYFDLSLLNKCPKNVSHSEDSTWLIWYPNKQTQYNSICRVWRKHLGRTPDTARTAFQLFIYIYIYKYIYSNYFISFHHSSLSIWMEVQPSMVEQAIQPFLAVSMMQQLHSTCPTHMLAQLWAHTAQKAQWTLHVTHQHTTGIVNVCVTFPHQIFMSSSCITVISLPFMNLWCKWPSGKYTLLL